jgi:hypothetical protein
MISRTSTSHALPGNRRAEHPAFDIDVLASAIVACVLWAIAIYAIAVSPAPSPEILATMGAFP